MRAMGCPLQVHAHMGILDVSLAATPTRATSRYSGSSSSLDSPGEGGGEEPRASADPKGSAASGALLDDADPTLTSSPTSSPTPRDPIDFPVSWPGSSDAAISSGECRQPIVVQDAAAAEDAAEVVSGGSLPVTRSGELSDESDVEEDRRRAVAVLAAAEMRHNKVRGNHSAVGPDQGSPHRSTAPATAEQTGDLPPGDLQQGVESSAGAAADSLAVQSPLAEGASMRSDPLQDAYAHAQAQLQKRNLHRVRYLCAACRAHCSSHRRRNTVA